MAHEDGFTLLEAMAALIIMALGITTLGRLMATGLAASEQAETLVVATQLARSAMARLGADERLAEGEASGDLEDGYHWRRVVRLLPAPQGEAPATGYAPAEVEVTVGRGPRHPAITLTTLRLMPLDATGRPR